MKTKVRVATVDDVPGLIKIKDQLPLTLVDGTTTTGGFLLGTDADTYRQYIEQDYCLVAEKENEIIGFGIILKDSSVRNSDIWLRRQQANWSIDIKPFESRKICYFEQLAFLKGHSRDVLKLAYNLARWAFEDGHTYLFTTTVHEPIVNLAAIPYILRASGKKVGNINELYAKIGAINSDIYGIESVAFQAAVTSSVFNTFLTNSNQVFR